jgi:antitoxin ParD1/3/4
MTSKNTSINLGDHYNQFIDQQVAAGYFGSRSEAIREGMRLLEINQTKLHFLRKALQEGEDSGYSTYNYQALLAEIDAEGNS